MILDLETEPRASPVPSAYSSTQILPESRCDVGARTHCTCCRAEKEQVCQPPGFPAVPVVLVSSLPTDSSHAEALKHQGTVLLDEY